MSATRRRCFRCNASASRPGRSTRWRSRTTPGTGNGAALSSPPTTVASLFEGIADLGVLPGIDAVLSGYLGAAETGAVLLDIVARVKAANPAALFCCDPVIGDTDTGSYVRDGVAEFFRDARAGAAPISSPPTASSSNT